MNKKKFVMIMMHTAWQEHRETHKHIVEIINSRGFFPRITIRSFYRSAAITQGLEAKVCSTTPRLICRVIASVN